MLTATLLGTAATRPLPSRALSSAVFSVYGRHLLLDCGEGTQLALHQHRISPMKITLIALTHYHGDHILGLPGLLQTLDTMNRTDPLYITGPAEDHEIILSALMTLAGELAYPVRFLPVPLQGLSLHELDSQWPAAAVLTAFPTLHRIPSQGYRLSLARLRRFNPEKALAAGIPHQLWRQLQSGQSISINEQIIAPDAVCDPERPGLAAVFTGDTAPCEAVDQAAQDADLLIMDATYPGADQDEKAALYGHSTFLTAAATAARAGAKQLWLTHFSAAITDPAEHLSAAREIFPAAECGVDGMTRCLTFSNPEL